MLGGPCPPKTKIPKRVYEGLEVVRRSGKTNMLDYNKVAHLAMKAGYSATAAWVLENKGLYAEGIFKGFEVQQDQQDQQC